MPNRLRAETSPYLQQHADNPVDWYAWGPEALERARREVRPILLSVGYSACHWCHVMAHESFEDPDVAAVMNRLFVNIKVDREERPDIDQIYQLAHQMLARRGGGWPLTMFLAPDGTPFFGGTYFPKTERYNLPGFADLCERVAELWRDKRSEIGEQNEQVRIALSSTLPAGGAHRSEFTDAPVRSLLDTLRQTFDAKNGGFGAAPKFPHQTDLELCIRAFALRGDRAALEMADTTLARMCDGGIFDHLGGGFCRYSTDAEWLIPHFEKMLYDNGPLLGLLADAWLATGRERFARCAADTAGWMLREMQSPEGGYYSSIDADSEHEEGRFYVWSRDELERLLAPEVLAVAAPYWGLAGEPNFEGRHWHLHVAMPLEAVAERAGVDSETAARRVESARETLFAEREKRIRPGCDDKILTSWNALAIRGMAHAGRVFGRDDWIDSAHRALAFLRDTMWADGRLRATYKDGRAHLNAYLDDHSFLIAAILELLQARFDVDDLEFAESLADVLLGQFEDRKAGGFYFTAHDHETLIHRPKPGHDNATASGNAVAAWGLNRLAALTGETRYADAAERVLALFYPAMKAQPAGFAAMTIALEETLAPPASLVLSGEPRALRDWQNAFARDLIPDTLVIAIANGVNGLPPILDKPPRSDAATGWLCRGATCLAPLSDLAELQRACRGRTAG